MNISHKLHNVWEVLLQPRGGPSVDGASKVQLGQGVMVQDEVWGKLTLGILEDDAGEVQKVDIRDGGLVPQSLNKLGNDCSDDAGTVSVPDEGLVTIVTNVNKVLQNS